MGISIISGVIMGFCALIMITIGISQWKSKKPVGFYTGEKAPEEKELSDVPAWNKRHGMMWIMYGVCILFAWICGLLLGDDLLALIPFLICVILPIPVMIAYHHKLVKKYRVA